MNIVKKSNHKKGALNSRVQCSFSFILQSYIISTSQYCWKGRTVYENRVSNIKNGNWYPSFYLDCPAFTCSKLCVCWYFNYPVHSSDKEKIDYECMASYGGL